MRTTLRTVVIMAIGVAMCLIPMPVLAKINCKYADPTGCIALIRQELAKHGNTYSTKGIYGSGHLLKAGNVNELTNIVMVKNGVETQLTVFDVITEISNLTPLAAEGSLSTFALAFVQGQHESAAQFHARASYYFTSPVSPKVPTVIPQSKPVAPLPSKIPHVPQQPKRGPQPQPMPQLQPHQQPVLSPNLRPPLQPQLQPHPQQQPIKQATPQPMSQPPVGKPGAGSNQHVLPQPKITLSSVVHIQATTHVDQRNINSHFITPKAGRQSETNSRPYFFDSNADTWRCVVSGLYRRTNTNQHGEVEHHGHAETLKHITTTTRDIPGRHAQTTDCLISIKEDPR